MDIQNKEALIAEIEQFKEEALKMHIVQVLADSYTNTNLFDYNIDSDGSVIWYKAQARQLWDFWQAAKAQAVPEGFVLVEKKNTEDWYLDESEGMWFDHDGIDGGLCELDIGEVQTVEHKEYLITESNTLYATKAWNEENQDVDCWTLFKTEEEANKAAAYCKAKFNDEPIEAQEQKG